MINIDGDYYAFDFSYQDLHQHYIHGTYLDCIFFGADLCGSILLGIFERCDFRLIKTDEYTRYTGHFVSCLF